MSKTLEKWDQFINCYFQFNQDPVAAYMQVYPRAAKESARVKSYDLLNRSYICNKISERKDIIARQSTEIAVKNAAEQLTGDLLTFNRKREILRDIAEGKTLIKTGKWMPVGSKATGSKKKGTRKAGGIKYEWMEWLEQPDHAARMKAIEIDNQMTGDIAPSRLFAAVANANDPDENSRVERFVILSNGEKIPL